MLPIGGAQNPNTSVTELIGFNVYTSQRRKPQIAAICRSFINCQIEIKYLHIQAVTDMPYRSKSKDKHMIDGVHLHNSKNNAKNFCKSNTKQDTGYATALINIHKR